MEDANYFPFIQIYDKVTREPLMYDSDFFEKFFSIKL
jgi:hypothetical protein